MTDLNKQMDRVSDMLATVSQLIECGRLKKDKNKVLGDLIVETIYDDECSMVVIERGMKGQTFPLHIHVGCVQYLVCVKGKFSINIPSDGIFKVLKPSECFAVGSSIAHSVHCLEDGSKLIGVVIPPEPAYRMEFR